VVTTSVPEEVVSIAALNVANASSSEIVAALSSALNSGINSQQATEIATSPKVLDSISGDQATEVFAQLDVGALSVEQEAALVATVSDAPAEVKEAFEGEIDVYGDGLDEYVPVNSNVDVGTRRSLVAAAAAISGVAAMGAAGAAGGSSGGSSGPSTGGSGGSSDRGSSSEEKSGIKESDELMRERQSLQTSIARRISKNTAVSSIGVMAMTSKKSNLSFSRKLIKTLSGLSFTLSGSVIVMFTLSGQTQKIAIVATSLAVIGHLIHVFIDDRPTETN
jgi:hypothetical protein